MLCVSGVYLRDMTKTILFKFALESEVTGIFAPVKLSLSVGFTVHIRSLLVPVVDHIYDLCLALIWPFAVDWALDIKNQPVSHSISRGCSVKCQQ